MSYMRLFLTSRQNSVAGQTVADNASLTAEKSASAKASTTKKRNSQAELLAGAVKRKRSL